MHIHWTLQLQQFMERSFSSAMAGAHPAYIRYTVLRAVGKEQLTDIATQSWNVCSSPPHPFTAC